MNLFDMKVAAISTSSGNGKVVTPFLLGKRRGRASRTDIDSSHDYVIVRPFASAYKHTSSSFFLGSMLNPMQTEHAQNMYIAVLTGSLRFLSLEKFLNESKVHENTSSAGILQVRSAKIATTLKPDTSRAYPVPIHFLNFSKGYHRFLIFGGDTFLSPLSVLKSEVSHEHDVGDSYVERS